MTESASEPEIGWRVLDPEGNVVDSGPITELEMVAFAGDTPPEEAE